MDQRLHFLTLATHDLDAVRRFYVDGLGWTALMDVEGEIVFFQVAPGLTLGFFDAGKFDEDTGVAGSGASVAGVTLAHNVDSEQAVRAAVVRVEAAGGAVVVAPEPGAFGGIFHAIVQDPNGVLWEIAHNPGWRVEDDGTVVFG